MANFARVPDVEVFLQEFVTDNVERSAIDAALTAVTAAITNYCRQGLELVEDETITLDCIGGTRILLPELPVVEVSQVIEDGETLVVDDDYKLGQHGIIHRIGAKWAAGIQIIQVTYSHGYATIPDDIVAVAARAASRAFQAGRRAKENDGVPGIASKSLGDFSVAFQAEGAGGMGEGVMGASAARLLLLSEKDVLDKYRI